MPRPRLTLLLALLLLAGCGAKAGAPLRLPAASALPLSKTSHVVVLVMENKEAGSVIGSRDAPFFNRLARRGALATRSFAIRHPSLPNYLALVGGSTFGIASDCTDCHVRAPSLADQLEAARLSWKAYLQGAPSPCFSGAEHGSYAKKHNPFAYFDDIAGNARRCARLVGFGALQRDLRAGRLPRFAWISPDLCNDTHDCGVRSGDRFLAGLVPALERELGPHGFLVVTYDEGSSDAGCCRLAHGGRIATLVLGPDVRRGTRSARPVDHFGVLATIEDAFGLPRLREAACACSAPLTPLFRRAPRLHVPAGG